MSGQLKDEFSRKTVHDGLNRVLRPGFDSVIEVLFAGTLSFNGNLTVLAPGYIPSSIEVFNLLDWINLSTVNFDSRYSAGSYSGYLLGNGDDNLGFDLPDISSSGFAWDIGSFITNGTIATVAIIPEPSRAVLLMLGLLGVWGRRRR